MKRGMMYAVYTVVLLAVLAMAYVRLAPHDAGLWHQDPEKAVPTGKPNEYRLTGASAVTFNVDASELAHLVDGFVQSQPRINRIAGGAESLMTTYVQRSVIMGYPDYITIKISPVGVDQSRLEIFSRSRFGRSDLGVNKRRIDQWIAAIKGLIAG